jgi:hypothetical protein
MIVKSLIAATMIVGSASLALAQTASFDGTPDKTLSYGPRASAAATANPAQAPIGADTFNSSDGTGDKSMSYGARPVR